MRVGYARTSGVEQQAGLDAQFRDLKGAGCEKIFSEQVSAVAKRPQLEAAIDFIREGDSLVVTRLDRLARSTQHLLEIAERMRNQRCRSLHLEPRRYRYSDGSADVHGYRRYRLLRTRTDA